MTSFSRSVYPGSSIGSSRLRTASGIPPGSVAVVIHRTADKSHGIWRQWSSNTMLRPGSRMSSTASVASDSTWSINIGNEDRVSHRPRAGPGRCAPERCLPARGSEARCFPCPASCSHGCGRGRRGRPRPATSCRFPSARPGIGRAPRPASYVGARRARTLPSSLPLRWPRESPVGSLSSGSVPDAPGISRSSVSGTTPERAAAGRGSRW